MYYSLYLVIIKVGHIPALSELAGKRAVKQIQ